MTTSRYQRSSSHQLTPATIEAVVGACTETGAVRIHYHGFCQEALVLRLLEEPVNLSLGDVYGRHGLSAAFWAEEPEDRPAIPEWAHRVRFVFDGIPAHGDVLLVDTPWEWDGLPESVLNALIRGWPTWVVFGAGKRNLLPARMRWRKVANILVSQHPGEGTTRRHKVQTTRISSRRLATQG